MNVERSYHCTLSSQDVKNPSMKREIYFAIEKEPYQSLYIITKLWLGY